MHLYLLSDMGKKAYNDILSEMEGKHVLLSSGMEKKICLTKEENNDDYHILSEMEKKMCMMREWNENMNC